MIDISMILIEKILYAFIGIASIFLIKLKDPIFFIIGILWFLFSVFMELVLFGVINIV